MDISVQREEDGLDLPRDDQVRRWVAEAVRRCGNGRDEVVVRFVDEEEIRRLNSRYRGKDKSTNVLSFPFEDPPGVVSQILGDIVISPGVVRQEAMAQSKAVSAHFAHLMVHGVLHLCGYHHEEEIAAHEMESREVEILKDLGFNDPYSVS